MRGVDGLLTFNTPVKSEVEVERLLDDVRDIEKIKEIAVPILKQYGVEKASVFGSYARGDQNQDSDIDILIEYAPNARKSLLVRARIINELKKALQRDVDVITKNSLSRFMRDQVLREKRVIM